MKKKKKTPRRRWPGNCITAPISYVHWPPQWPRSKEVHLENVRPWLSVNNPEENENPLLSLYKRKNGDAEEKPPKPNQTKPTEKQTKPPEYKTKKQNNYTDPYLTYKD